MITLETFVEASVVRISLDQTSANAEIELMSADKRTRWCLLAAGVDDFQAEDLRLNSTVDEALIYGADDAGDEEFLAQLYQLLRGQELVPADLSWPFLQERARSVVSGELKFWVIKPVLGGAISILAKEIFVREEPARTNGTEETNPIP